MSLKLLASFAATAAAFAMISCTSTESDADISASLMAHSWKIQSALAAPALIKDGKHITNVLDSLESACDRHDIVHYLGSDSVTVSSDSVGCGGGNGKWTLSGNVVTTIFQKDGRPDTTIYTVVSVSTTQLTLTSVVSAQGGQDSTAHTVTETYTAQ